MMEIGAIPQATALDALTAAWAEAVSADAAIGIGAEAAVPPAQGPHGWLAGAEPPQGAPALADAAPESTATQPEPADLGPQVAAVQTFGRPHAPVIEPLRTADSTLPNAMHAGSEFAIPADQLVQLTLTGLQIEAAAAWPMLRRSPFAPHPESPHPPQERERAGCDEWAGHADSQPQHDEDPGDASPEEACAELPVLDADDEGAWCAPLTRALSAALAEPAPPRALLAAAQQWQRGRCVVLACPQGCDPAGAAWAFVLWPLRRLGTAGRPALRGLRVPARLHWSAPPQGVQWCHVRAVKEHHPRRGRQLVALDAGAAGGALPCEIQLGPVLAHTPRRCEVSLRIDAVRRFWSALGAQWSASVVVCSLPLSGLVEASPC